MSVVTPTVKLRDSVHRSTLGLYDIRIDPINWRSDRVQLSLSPALYRSLGELDRLLDRYVFGRCLNVESFQEASSNAFKLFTEWRFDFRVTDGCPDDPFHLCRVSKRRFEAIMSLGEGL